jgi:hypothetical protein
MSMKGQALGLDRPEIPVSSTLVDDQSCLDISCRQVEHFFISIAVLWAMPQFRATSPADSSNAGPRRIQEGKLKGTYLKGVLPNWTLRREALIDFSPAAAHGRQPKDVAADGAHARTLRGGEPHWIRSVPWTENRNYRESGPNAWTAAAPVARGTT